MTPTREQELLSEIARLRSELERSAHENQLLRQRLDLILRKLFDKKNESLDTSQLELLLDPEAAKKADAAGEPHAPAADTTSTSSQRTPRKPRDLSRLEVREIVLIPEPVKACPDAWREIDRVETDRLDYQPASVFIERLIRPVFVRCSDPDAAPIKSPAPPSMRPGLSATPRLIAHVMVAKFRDHLPFYRQSAIWQNRHGIELARHTLCRWADITADTLDPLYKLTHRNLLQAGVLQADESPVRFLDPGRGKCATGYYWGLHAPQCGAKGDILFQWHPSRRTACLDDLLPGYTGILQTDGYAAYDSWRARNPGVALAACWAHARRKFHEAFKAGHAPAAAPLRHIQHIYQIEKQLRQTRAGPEERTRVRQAEAVPILGELHQTLLQLQRQVLPRNPVGEAVAYTLTLWTRLNLYVTDGRIEVDNNNLENAFRPPAVGKKNWLFVGGEGTGQRGAILHTLLENAVRHGHNPEAWLTDVLERLPAMTNRDDLEILLPSHWQSPAATRATLATCA